ncbi:unnamed protein product [Meganyctiphanes norvegica]|uniref:BPTI/Kunitz inhibitor domain-containing protein n=1 Tax=Meganyctiphanes norvegica TaxID=48144 RepID=A0AAV2QWX1_MEGNR
MMSHSVAVLLSLVLFGVVKSQGFVLEVANQCYDPVSPGPCRALIPSFYFNPLTETCDCFTFSGCQSNGNKFDSLNECMSTCSVRPQLQTISPTCIRLFGADDSNFNVTSRPFTPRPDSPSNADPLEMFTSGIIRLITITKLFLSYFYIF